MNCRSVEFSGSRATAGSGAYYYSVDTYEWQFSTLSFVQMFGLFIIFRQFGFYLFIFGKKKCCIDG